MTRLAETVTIDVEDFKFEVDGEEFPWFLSEAGPTVRKVGENLWCVGIGLISSRDGIGNGLIGGLVHPHMDERIEVFGHEFPYTITDKGYTWECKLGELPVFSCEFYAKNVETNGPYTEEITHEPTDLHGMMYG